MPPIDIEGTSIASHRASRFINLNIGSALVPHQNFARFSARCPINLPVFLANLISVLSEMIPKEIMKRGGILSRLV